MLQAQIRPFGTTAGAPAGVGIGARHWGAQGLTLVRGGPAGAGFVLCKAPHKNKLILTDIITPWKCGKIPLLKISLRLGWIFSNRTSTRKLKKNTSTKKIVKRKKES